MIKALFTFSAITTLVAGCTSSLKKNCEATNWYERGYAMSKQGALPEGDFFLKRCRLEDATIDYGKLDVGFKKGREEVCDPMVAEKMGKEGSQYSFPICMNFNENIMIQSYRRGLNSYCQIGNAYKVGVAGKDYNNVCDNDKFKAQYMNGRKDHLHAGLKNKQRDLKSVKAKLKDLRQQQNNLKQRLTDRRLLDTQRSDLTSELNELSFSIDNLKSEENVLLEDISKLDAELAKI